MANNEVKIPISLPGAGKAAQDAQNVAAGLDKVGAATGKAGKATEDQAKAAQGTTKRLNELGEASEKGAAAGRLLGQALQGNIFVLSRLGDVLKVTGAAIKTGVFGILLIGATALFEFLPRLIARMKGVSTESDNMAEKANETTQAIEELNNAKLDDLRNQIEGITQGTKGSLDFLNQLNAAATRIDNARMQLELAELGADSSVSPEEKKSRELAIRQRYSDQASSRERSAIEDRVAALAKDESAKSGLANSAESQADAMRGRVNSTILQRSVLNKLMQDLKDSYFAQLNAAGRDMAAKEEISKAFSGRFESVATMQSVAFGPAADNRLAAMREQLNGLEAEAKLARAAQRQAEAELQSARQIADLDQSERPIVRGLNARAARIAAGLPEKTSQFESGNAQVHQPGEFSVRNANGEEIGRRIAEKLNLTLQVRDESIVQAVGRAMRESSERSAREFEEKLKAHAR